MSYTVLYWNWLATPELVRMVEEQMPDGWQLPIPAETGNSR